MAAMAAIPKGQRKAHYTKPFAVRELEGMYIDQRRMRYPDNPYLAPQDYDDRTANGLTKCIIDFIRFNGHQAERINTTGRPIDQTRTFTDVTGRMRTIGSIKWIKGTTTNGSADISATIDGRSVKVEVKIGSDKQSQAQKEYQLTVEAAGGLYFLAHNFTEFKQWFDRL